MAENFDHIDQIVRQKFENFEPEPPVKVWENVRSHIAPPSGSPGIVMPLIVAVSLLFFMVGLIHQIFEAKSASQDLISENFVSPDKEPGTLDRASALLSDNTSPTVPPQSKFESNASSISDGQSNTSAPYAIPVRAPFQTNNQASGKKNSQQTYLSNSTDKNSPDRRSLWRPGLRQTMEAGELSYADAVYYNLTLRDIRKLSGYADYARKNTANWSIGLYFHPEITSYQDKSLDNTISYGLSILPQLTFNKFFIQGGINFRQTHDKGNYAIDYNRYLGAYEDVYMVTFDSTENGVIPTYYTETVYVYDTIDHYTISETRANYTYLDVPLLAGYRIGTGRFVFSIKAGPSASFMLVRNIPLPGGLEENARIVNADYQVSARSSVSWQLNVGAGFEYLLTDKLNFGMEPTFRFALKPEYELPTSSGWKSSTFGVRVGLRYNF